MISPFMFNQIIVPKETFEGERRVAASPETVRNLRSLGYEIAIEQGAGEAASFSDEAYREQGAEIVPNADALWQRGDIVLKVRAPSLAEADQMKPGTTLISFIAPAQNPKLLEKLESQNVTALAVDQIPRITRAQKLDALSSMANIAGYRAVIEAAHNFGRLLGGQSTAAGRIPPAKVLIIGAGVAGLSAIGTARGLGAMVRAFDARPEVAQQIESMGADFLTVSIEEDTSGGGGYAKQVSDAFLEAELALFSEQAKEVDIIITTALIPGKPAPKLITENIVKQLKPGSVIVDLAAEQGGNCELTEADKAVVKHGVTIIGYTNLPSRMAGQSSRLYASNLQHFMRDLTPGKDGTLVFDMEDVVTRSATVTRGGKIMWPPPPLEVPAPPKPAASEPAPEVAPQNPRRKGLVTLVVAAAGALGLLGLGQVAPPEFMTHFTVFVLACLVGWQVVWNVTPALHTPLMSVTNAISGIIIIGALLQTSDNTTTTGLTLALISAMIAMVNVAGGFLVTQRMLNMFRREK